MRETYIQVTCDKPGCTESPWRFTPADKPVVLVIEGKAYEADLGPVCREELRQATAFFRYVPKSRAKEVRPAGSTSLGDLVRDVVGDTRPARKRAS